MHEAVHSPGMTLPRQVLAPGERAGGRTTVAGFFAVALAIAATYRFPFLDQLEAYKFALFGAEIVAVALLAVVVGARRFPAALVAIVAFLVVARLCYGAIVANLALDQGLVGSLLEARFGLMIVAAPLVIAMFRHASDLVLARFILAYLAFVLAADLAVFYFLASEQSLLFGIRTDQRFFCSVMPPLAAALVLLMRASGGRASTSGKFVLAAVALATLHAFLVSTSRTETLMGLAILAFGFATRWPVSRWILYLFGLAAVVGIVVGMTLDDADGVAGRDYGAAARLLTTGMPFGFGAVNDTVAKAALGLPETFFFSDYGILMYPMRYGVLGVVIALGLLAVWLGFLLANVRRPGFLPVGFAFLAYLLLIPLLDYGSLVGAFVLAVMLAGYGATRGGKQAARA